MTYMKVFSKVLLGASNPSKIDLVYIFLCSIAVFRVQDTIFVLGKLCSGVGPLKLYHPQLG